jgi:hypothetical protein
MTAGLLQMAQVNEKNWLTSQTELQQRIATLEKQNAELTGVNASEFR